MVGLQKLKWLIFSLFDYYDIFERTQWAQFMHYVRCYVYCLLCIFNNSSLLTTNLKFVLFCFVLFFVFFCLHPVQLTAFKCNLCLACLNVHGFETNMQSRSKNDNIVSVDDLQGTFCITFPVLKKRKNKSKKEEEKNMYGNKLKHINLTMPSILLVSIIPTQVKE